MAPGKKTTKADKSNLKKTPAKKTLAKKSPAKKNLMIIMEVSSYENLLKQQQVSVLDDLPVGVC